MRQASAAILDGSRLTLFGTSPVVAAVAELAIAEKCRETAAPAISPRCEPWCWNTYLHDWVIEKGCW